MSTNGGYRSHTPIARDPAAPGGRPGGGSASGKTRKSIIIWPQGIPGRIFIQAMNVQKSWKVLREGSGTPVISSSWSISSAVSSNSFYPLEMTKRVMLFKPFHHRHQFDHKSNPIRESELIFSKKDIPSLIVTFVVRVNWVLDNLCVLTGNEGSCEKNL